jgi:predicted O-methyltransferase YrrM
MSVIRERILAMYSDRHLRKSAIRHEDAAVFEQLLAGKKYRTVLEIGTYRGCTAAEMSQYCERVVTFDLYHGRTEKDEQSVSRKVLWDSLGVKNVDLILVNDDAEKKARIAAMDFDFAFVDGAHDYESVRFDFELVRKCGRVLFHDYYAGGDDRNPDDVYRFVNSIHYGRVTVFGIFALWTI